MADRHILDVRPIRHSIGLPPVDAAKLREILDRPNISVSVDADGAYVVDAGGNRLWP